MNKKGQIDGLNAISFGIIIMIICFGLLFFTLISNTINDSKRNEQRENFCQKNDLTYSANYYFCKGKAFTCNTEKCYYIESEVIVKGSEQLSTDKQ